MVLRDATLPGMRQIVALDGQEARYIFSALEQIPDRSDAEFRYEDMEQIEDERTLDEVINLILPC